MITKFAASAYKEFSEDLAARFPHLYHQMMEDLAQPYRNPEIVARNPKLLEKVLPRIQGQLHNKQLMMDPVLKSKEDFLHGWETRAKNLKAHPPVPRKRQTNRQGIASVYRYRNDPRIDFEKRKLELEREHKNITKRIKRKMRQYELSAREIKNRGYWAPENDDINYERDRLGLRHWDRFTDVSQPQWPDTLDFLADINRRVQIDNELKDLARERRNAFGAGKAKSGTMRHVRGRMTQADLDAAKQRMPIPHIEHAEDPQAVRDWFDILGAKLSAGIATPEEVSTYNALENRDIEELLHAYSSHGPHTNHRWRTGYGGTSADYYARNYYHKLGKNPRGILKLLEARADKEDLTRNPGIVITGDTGWDDVNPVQTDLDRKFRLADYDNHELDEAISARSIADYFINHKDAGKQRFYNTLLRAGNGRRLANSYISQAEWDVPSARALANRLNWRRGKYITYQDLGNDMYRWDFEGNHDAHRIMTSEKRRRDLLAHKDIMPISRFSHYRIYDSREYPIVEAMLERTPDQLLPVPKESINRRTAPLPFNEWSIKTENPGNGISARNNDKPSVILPRKTISTGDNRRVNNKTLEIAYTPPWSAEYVHPKHRKLDPEMNRNKYLSGLFPNGPTPGHEPMLPDL